jgi:putative glycosyltransferase (exosortase G-associated)
MQLTGELIVQLGFWLTWLIIPIVYELVPTVIGLIRLAFTKRDELKEPQMLPQISLIVPTLNSAETLYQCIESISKSSYPVNLIRVIIADNQSTDKTFQVFHQAQVAFPELRMQWISTQRGKAQALNAAIYNTNGKYIVHIDSDGTLEKRALMNMVKKFESDPTVDALTGTILIDEQKISRKFWLRLLQKNEAFEYFQAFLAGRVIESANNQLFTMSGAFSAFRRERLLRTRLYDTKTIGEDIDMTFQIWYELKGKIELCHNAVFYTEPIKGLDSLYSQRQRWQRGEFFTVRKFMHDNMGITAIFKNFVVRRLLIDHTVLFLRMIWLFAFFILVPFGYSFHLVAMSFLLLYILYVGIVILNFISANFYLRAFPSDHSFCLRNWWVTFTLPLFMFLTGFIQMVGIINAMTQPAQWKVKNYHEEYRIIKKIIHHDLKEVTKKNEE